jgi:hypothetical protein
LELLGIFLHLYKIEVKQLVWVREGRMSQKGAEMQEVPSDQAKPRNIEFVIAREREP